jgi:hypothetical protein
MPWYLGNSTQIRMGAPGFIVPLAVWSVIWTGLALWNSAKRGEKWWFIFFLIVHTAGIVEILYLIFVVKLFSNAKPKKVTRPSRKR